MTEVNTQGGQGYPRLHSETLNPAHQSKAHPGSKETKTTGLKTLGRWRIVAGQQTQTAGLGRTQSGGQGHTGNRVKLTAQPKVAKGHRIAVNPTRATPQGREMCSIIPRHRK